MTGKTAYSVFLFQGRMHVITKRCMIFCLFLLLFPVSLTIIAQELPEYDEISVFLEVPGIGGGEISAVIRGEELYLPVTDLFDFLKIRNVPSPELESVSGFFIEPEATIYYQPGRKSYTLPG